MNLLLAIISGVLTAVSFPTAIAGFKFPNLGFLAWFSLAPLFFAIRDKRPRQAFLLTFVASVIYYGVSLYWIYNVMEKYGGLPSYASVSVLALLVLMLSMFISFAPMASAWISGRLGIDKFWTLPLIWVALEFARNYFPCNGFPWSNITNSQYAYLPVIQVTDVVGIYGLTFVMVAVNYAATYLGQHGGWGKKCFALSLVLAVLIYGYYRVFDISVKQERWPSMKVALLQGNIAQEMKWRPGQEEGEVAPYVKYTQMLKDSGANLIIWPESGFPWPISESTENLPPRALGLEPEKDSINKFLLFGALTNTSKPGDAPEFRNLYNSMYLADTNGNILGRYHKMHLVPFGEYVPYKKALFFIKKMVAPIGNFAAGSDARPLFTDGYQLGGLICYEDIFPEIARKMSANGANILTAITNDAWFGNTSAPYQHLAISVFRAVENRRWLVKAANTGVSAVVDATGRVISKTGIFEQGMIVSQVRLSNGETIYGKYGDFFAWACSLAFVLLLLMVTYDKFKRAKK
jgi:apolipoprotein N-acyltransferase